MDQIRKAFPKWRAQKVHKYTHEDYLTAVRDVSPKINFAQSRKGTRSSTFN